MKLSDQQLEAINRVNKASRNIARLVHQVNQAIEANGLEVKPHRDPESGRLIHDCATLLFHHQMALNAERLEHDRHDAGEVIF